MDTETLDSLETQIRESADSGIPVETKIATSQRVIARITDGIYREPWAAFRELIANAYDADASYVVVETGAPEFTQITVRDDGLGMSAKTLAYVIRNIGGSSKRTVRGVELKTTQEEHHDRSPGGRMLIGKIGIGLFAVAQLTQHFQIITKAAGETIRTSATVRLRTHNEDGVTHYEDEYSESSVTIKSERVAAKEAPTHGTTVVLYSLRPEVKRSLQSLRRWQAALVEPADGETVQDTPIYHIGYLHNSISANEPERKPNLPWKVSDTPSEKFKNFFDRVSESPSRGTKAVNLELFDEYLRLIWKLSLSLPLEYIDRHPFAMDGSTGVLFFNYPKGKKQSERIFLSEHTSIEKHLDLRSSEHGQPHGFTVTLDGIELKRPISLPTKLEKQSRIKAPVMLVSRQDNPFHGKDIDRAGGRLSFDAYLYWNSKIIPKDTAGVLIRIREASGTLFDSTFLNYQVSEQTRLRQITAEIFVHEGLDSAINIDRESYNYSHPHFLFIQRWLHNALRLLVNRLKSLATEDLQQEKKQRQATVKADRQSLAVGVWQRRLGEDADPPLQSTVVDGFPEEVGNAVISWPFKEARSKDSDKAQALAVVLEAYGVLSNLSVEDRGRLIEDILNLFEVGK